MATAESFLPLNCPKCPRELTYVASTSSLPEDELDTHFYNCPEHRGVVFLPNGRIETYSFTN